MKKLLPILLSLFLFSCSTDEDQKTLEQGIEGTWVLFKTLGPDSEKTGSEMAFQETYTLNEDGSFTKTRDEEGEEIQSTGTFEVVPDKGAAVTRESQVFLILKLQHDSDELTTSCEGDDTIEYLHFRSHLLENQHDACDGSRLMYEKEE